MKKARFFFCGIAVFCGFFCSCKSFPLTDAPEPAAGKPVSAAAGKPVSAAAGKPVSAAAEKPAPVQPEKPAPPEKPVNKPPENTANAPPENAANKPPEIARRAEETVAYIDTPLEGELPEPFYGVASAPAAAAEPAPAPPPAPPSPASAAAAAPPPAAPRPAAPAAPPRAPPAAARPAAPVTPPAAPPAPPPVPPANVRSAEAAPPDSGKDGGAASPEGRRASAAKIPSDAVDRLEKPAPSRTVRVRVGQLLEIPFRGAGWVYMGETNLKRGLEYDSRKSDPDGLLFVFIPRETGEYLLKFSKHDFYNDYQIEDTVAVTVGSAEPAAPGAAPRELTRVRASPRWPPADWAPPGIRGAASAPREIVGADSADNADGADGRGNAESSGTQAAENGGRRAAENSAGYRAAIPSNKSSNSTAPAAAGITASAAASANTASAASAASAAADVDGKPLPDIKQIVSAAQSAYNAGNIALALENLNKIDDAGLEPDDTALYLRGKAYEAPGGARNIKNSIGAYTSLTRQFPQSPYYSEAEKRIAYLNKYYFNIR